MKTMKLILSNKGGVGKSVFEYQLGNVAVMNNVQDKCLFMDLDNETKTSINHLKFLPNIAQVDLVDPVTKSIDRTLFDKFLLKFYEGDFMNAICDFGATSSDQFLKYLESEGAQSVLKYMTKDLGLNLELYVIVAGNDSFRASMQYAVDLMKVTKNFDCKKVICKNRYFSYSQAQNKEISKLSQDNDGKVIDFGLTEESESGDLLNNIKSMMSQGKSPLLEKDMITKLRFTPVVKNLDVEILDMSFQVEK